MGIKNQWLRINPYSRWILQKKRKNLQKCNITILASNCLGGLLYHTYQLKFSSPLVNTRIDSQEEIKIRLAGVPEKAKVTWHELKKKPLRCRVESVGGQTYVTIPQIAAWNAGFLEIK